MGTVREAVEEERKKNRNNEEKKTSLSVRESVEQERKSSYISTNNSNKTPTFDYETGKKGWQKYLNDQSNAEQKKAKEKEDEKWWETLGRYLGSTGATDTTLSLGNTGQIINDVRNDTSYQRPNDDWSEDQQYEFGALYLESPGKAYAYAEKINNENNKAKEAAEIEKIQNSATSSDGGKFGHTLGAIATAPLGMADYLNMLVLSNAGRDPSTSDGIVSPFEYSTAVTEGIATDFNNAYGTLDENIPIIGGKGWGDVYGLGVSIAQSAISGFTQGPVGTLFTYFGQGAASGMKDALDRGASTEQAVLYGTALGAFEGIAEQIGIDNLFKIGSSSTIKGLLKNILNQAIAEGAEEGITTFMSTIADDFIMQDKSQLNQLVAEYMKSGMSEEEAKKQAAKDIWSGLAFDALAGFVSGGVHGGASTTIQTGISNYNTNKYFGNQAQDIVNDALNSPRSDVQAIGQKYQEKLNGGKKLSGWNLNELIEVTDTDKIKNAVLQRLGELGETSDVTAVAEVLVKQAMGEELSFRDQNILNQSKYGNVVATELSEDNIKSGGLANNWAAEIGTRKANPEVYNKTQIDAFKEVVSKAVTKESKYKVSEDGKTTLNDQEVSIQGVESIKGGEVTVRLESGETVNASDLKLSDKEALMYDIISRMDATPDTANKILNDVKPVSAAQASMYYHSIPLAYEYGKINYEAGLKNINLPKALKQNVYTRGRIDAMIQAEAKTPKTNVAQKGSNKTKSGIIYEDGFVYNEASANEMQRVSMAHIEVINKMSNLEVHIFESKVENGKRVAYVNGKLVSAPNGYFKDGNKIYIDFNAGNKGEGAMLYTMSHEITHYIREWNAEGFKELGDFLIEQYGKKGVNVEYLLEQQRKKIKKRYAAEGKALPSEAKLNDMAYEEMVADAMSDMLADPKAYEKLAKLKQQNKTLWEKVGEAIKAVLDKLKAALGVYKGKDVATEAARVRDFSSDVYDKLQDLYIKAFVEADANYAEAERTLSDNGITVDPSTESASIYSVRDVLDDDQRQNVAKALATRFNVTQKEALQWLSAETSLASLILNPKYSQYLDYEPDPNEVAIKTNSDYPQGTVDFSPICAKRREFTAVMNNVLRLFKNHVFAATDLAKIRSIMQEEGMTIPCGICYVEDRRQLDTIVAQNFIDSLKLYREGSKTRPDGKAFNTNQLKGLKLTDGDSYTPTIYELVSLEGLNVLKEKNPSMAEAWIKFNNARGMQSVRLLANEAEYKRQILKYGKQTVKAKNDKGGLRIYSFSDAEMFHLIDIIQVITDSATVGLSLQGYTKVNEYAKAVKDTGEKLNRSLIPKGELGYHIEDGKVVLDYDTVEGIDINHPDFFDNKDNPNVGNITIGVSDTQIRAAMVSDFVDQIIPFHTGQSEDVLGEKGISTWSNYKDFQTEKDIATGKVSDHQINIYTEVLQPLEEEGKPITKRTFVEKFLQVCKENNLTPRFSQFLNTNANGEFVYTEGYHKMLVDFKTFAQTETGEYLPQMPVKPIFDNEYITKILKDYVKSQEIKDAELAKSMPKVIERITNEIIKPSETKFSDRDSEYLDAVNRGDMITAQKMVDEAAKKAGYTIKAYHGTNADFTVFDKNRVGKGNDQYGAGFYFASNPDVTEGYGTKRYDTYLDIKKPINLISKPGGKGKTLYDVRITQAQAYQILKRHPLMYDPENSPLGYFYDKYWEVGAKEWMVRDLAKNYDSIGLLDGDVILYRDYPNELHEAIRDVLGYDGVQVYFETDAMVDERNDYFYVAWFDNQMKSSDPVVRDDNGNVIPLSERFKADNNDIRYSDRDPYSYETLTSKPDMKITTLDGTVPSNRADVVFQAKKNAASIGKANKDGSVSVYVKDVDVDVILSKKGLIHGLDRRFKELAPITVKAGEILQNSIKINELTPSKKEADSSYVLIGAAENSNGELCIVRSVVNKFSNELDTMDVLYAINAKKGTAVLNAPLVSTPDYRTTISIAQLLEFVNRYFPDILPESVLRHYGYDARPDGELGENALYSERDPNATSNRTLLANALETAAKTEKEKEKLKQYKTKIALIDSEQARLTKIRAEIKELSFAKGPRDTAKIRSLQDSATQIENRINTYDRQLLNLESTEALKDVLQREKQMAYKKAQKEGREALQRQKEKDAETVRTLLTQHRESRQRATESRNKTAMKAKIKKVVHDLNKLLLNPTQDKHVPIGLQRVVAEALDAINMDSMNAEERVAYYNDLISKSSDPDEIAMLTKKRDFFEYRDMNFKERITELKNAYAEFKESDDPLIRNAHNDAIADLIKNTADEVGNKSLKDMSLSQLERVYDMYKVILATVRNANKMFKEGRQETVTENSDAVKIEVRSVGGHKDRVLKMTKFLKKFGWDMLKPVTAMKVIGSTTFERLFNNVRAAEDTWAVDVNEAKQFFDDIAAKYGYNKWDLKKYYTFKDSAGTNISITLEQIMSLYAYSKRNQADKHLEDGGFVFDDAIEVVEKNKLGIPLKYEVNDANPYRLRKEHLLDITDALTKEQKDFVDAMQTYLSDVMGAKGNEVSLAMYDIKLYKEQNYFPLKTSRYFREFDPEKSATPKIKNSGFSKKTVPQAGNPIVLSNFMDVWAGHVNDMSMYHAFVLPLEDFMRVYNYSSTTGGYDSVQQYIKNAYGAQANQYIEKLMDDLNGGARVDSSAGIINKGLSLFKKASVFASASVVVQQPSAIARALAYINPKYFAKATPEALNIAKHKTLWAEVKKYAPVAVIKEMGYFDTGVGRSTVEWIKGNQTFKDKMDDVLSKAPAIADELCWVHIWEAVKRENAAKSKSKVGSEIFLMECGKRFTEVITNTQVYDSVLSRSGMMRSKDTGMKMATAFMAEPTTTVNMMVDGIVQGMRGNKKFTASTVGAISASIILNAILVSLVYAARDDDEDETYTEKYIGSVTSELLDGFNPLTYIPFVKDIWSIAQGYDVERSDMSVVSKLWESIESLFNENKSGLDKVLEVAGSVSSLFGIPLKNIIRDAKGMYNLTNTILSGMPTTGAGIKDAIEDSFKSSIPLWDRLHESDSKSDKLYDAIMSGDQNQIDRAKAKYKSEQALETALKTALRENDSRINEAAQARLDGNISEYTRIAREIIAEGHFSQDTVVAAINAETNAIKKAQSEPTESTDDKDEATSIYKADDINAAFDNGDKALALSIIDELVEMKVANGMDEAKAKSSLRSSMTSYWKPLYIAASESGNTSEMQRIKQILYYSGLYGSAADVVKAVKNWTK